MHPFSDSFSYGQNLPGRRTAYGRSKLIICNHMPVTDGVQFELVLREE